MKQLIIFGANGALGSGVTDVLIQKDFDKVYVVDRRGTGFAKENIISLQLSDATNPEEVNGLFKKIEFNPGDEIFLFSTIGGFLGGKSLKETSYNEWEKMMKLNLDSAFLISKYFLSNVPEGATGSLLFTSAFSSFSFEENKIAYNLSKAGLNYLVQSLSSEIFPKSFGINAIAPFILDTPANREWMDDQSQLVSPGEIGELIFSIFKNYRILSGNIIKLRGTILAK
ncbi:MAG: SDR family oxidoreductase [Ignavibacteria bacterium]|nr:MAG: SDR family oxidoreductase [Ignavibacteria bacterium]